MIRGGSSSDRARAQSAYERVIEILPSESEVSIEIVALGFGWPQGTEARSTQDGVKILAQSMGGHAGRAEYLLYEEIAHHIAAEEGLPHVGNAGMFLQEFLAGFVKFSLAQRHDPHLMQFLTMPEIGTSGWQRFYGFGTDLGALLAGLPMVDGAVNRFLANSSVAEPVRSAGAELKGELQARQWSPPELLDWCIRQYPGLSESWDRL